MIFSDTVAILDTLGRNNNWTWISPQYRHRNGETKAPTEPGLYWFRGTCDLWTGTINLQMALHTIERDGRLLVWEERSQEHLRVQCFAGQWWGPIVAPWESENVNQ